MRRLFIFISLVCILFFVEIKTKMLDLDFEPFDYKKKIALITSLPYHFECIGFLCELFKEYKIHIYHIPEINNENYIGYFKKLYSNIENFDLKYFTKEKETEYFRIINLTSYDNHKINSVDKSISIIHFDNSDDPNDNLYYKNNIVLSPLVELKITNIVNIIPIYNGYNYNFNVVNKNRDKTIIFIGRLFSNDLERFDNFIGKINYKILFFSRKKSDPSNEKLSSLKNIHKIENYYGKNIEFLVNKLKMASFVYIDKKTDRLSGAISLCLSNNVPMIIDSYQQKKYKFPAITYDENINEITDKINKITDKEYSDLMKSQLSYSSNILKEYPQKLKLLLNNS